MGSVKAVQLSGDVEAERRVRDRLTAHVEEYAVHIGCGGEVTGDPDRFGQCAACGKNVEWSDTAEPWELDVERDVSTLIVGIDYRDARIAELEATIKRVRGASREILKEQKGPCGRFSDPAWSAYESALEYIAAALDPTTEGSK